MHRPKPTERQKRERAVKDFRVVPNVLRASKALNGRFTILSQQALNGAAVGPFDSLASPAAQTALQVSGGALFVVKIVTAGVRVGRSVYAEIDVVSEIAALEQMMDCLRRDGDESEDAVKARRALQYLLDDARDCQRHPGRRTLLTSLCIGGETAGALVLGTAGGTTGAALGAACGGPIGAVVGGVVGAFAGAKTGSELGGSAVTNFRADATDGSYGTQMHGCVVGLGGWELLAADGYTCGRGLQASGQGVSMTLLQTQRSQVDGDDDQPEPKVTVGRLGATAGLSTSEGVSLGVEAKALWWQTETDTTKTGYGLNLDTGLRVTGQEWDVAFLGIGFHSGADGTGFKLPFWNVIWKKGVAADSGVKTD